MKDSQYYGILNVCENHAIPTQTAVNDITRIANELAISRCSFPKEHTITDRHTGIARRVFLPCGHCYHCTETHGNEWVTRMYHETQQFGESTCVYFVTLTYAGFKQYQFIPQFLLNAYWRKDSLNSRHTLDWRPCLCRMEHLAYFVRNLRRFKKQSDKTFDFSWVACCEYGSSHGAPHFHMILYTNKPIHFSDIMRGWSYNVGTRKIPRYKTIGRVDCVDLNNNGTMQGTKDKSAKRCFSYVAKYMYKMELPDHARLRLFYDDLKQNRVDDSMLQMVFDESVCKQKLVVEHWNNHVRKILENERDYEIFKSGEDPDIALRKYNKPLYNYFHEHVNLLSMSQDCDDAEFLKLDALRTFYFSDLVRLFRAKVRVSHSHAIGVVHMQRNVAEYSQNGLKLADAAFGKLVVPRYYERCVANYFAPIQSLSASPSGSTSFARFVSPLQVQKCVEYLQTGRFSDSLSCLLHPDLLALLPSALSRADDVYFSCTDKQPSAQKLIDYVLRQSPAKLLRSNYAIRDIRSSMRGYIGFMPNSSSTLAVYWFLYNRGSRRYDLQTVEDFRSFAQGVIDCATLYSSYKDHMILQSENGYRQFIESNERVQNFFARINPPADGEDIVFRPNLDSLIKSIQDYNDVSRDLLEHKQRILKESTTKKHVLL